MKKHKRFKHNGEIGPADLLIHAVSILDTAAEIATKAGNFEQLMLVYEGALEASGQLIALSLEGETEENERPRERLPFGLVANIEPSPEDIDLTIEKDQ
jgi:hypothetical protein